MTEVSLLTKTYAQPGDSQAESHVGMRQMRSRAFAKRNCQYLLIKSPPASGKSRAMMYIALDKLRHQGINKVVIIVPEMSIGRSFASTDLTSSGFFADWQVAHRYNLCLNTLSSDTAKTQIFAEFMADDNPAQVLVCTHHSFRFGYDKLDNPKLFDKVLLGIDEFHHVSASDNSRLGAILDEIMSVSDAHVVALTGSYFRGDAIPILTPEDEERFEKVTYSYYEQLNGYTHLKSLSLDYKFYGQSFFDALSDCFDTTKKTIVHIPNVNSQSAETDKYNTVGKIMDIIGEPIAQDLDTGVWLVATADGRTLKLADLVTDDEHRPQTQQHLAQISHRDDMDIIIALGMAKEGFDWVYCEHVLTIGYRGSMTEVVQIIGRATRDCVDKTHAKFTNVIAKPDANQDDVVSGVNDMLKAISLSLLMEQVLAPNVNFRRRSTLTENEKLPTGTIIIDDGKDGSRLSKRAEKILRQDMPDLIATIAQDTRVSAQYLSSDEGRNVVDSEIINDTIIPQIIRTRYPDLDDKETDQVMQGLLAQVYINSHGGMIDGDDISPDAVIENEELYIFQDGRYINTEHLSPEQRAVIAEHVRHRDLPDDAKIFDPHTQTTTKKSVHGFVKIGEKFINVDKIPVDLIHAVNPFAKAYEVLSKNIDSDTLKTINNVVKATKSNISEAEAVQSWTLIERFFKTHGREPDPNSTDPREARMGLVLAWVRNKKAERLRQQQNTKDNA